MNQRIRPIVAAALTVLWAGSAAATPITYELVSLTQTCTGSAALGITTLSSASVGTGDITVSGGEIVSGTGSGGDYTMNISVPALSTFVDIAYTSHVINSISSVAGAVTAAGTNTVGCTGPGAGFLCTMAQGPGLPWIWPDDDGTLAPETATITNFVGSDTNFSFDVVYFVNSDLGANGTVEVTQTWHFESVSVPEPGTVMLLGAGLLGLLVTGRRRA